MDTFFLWIIMWLPPPQGNPAFDPPVGQGEMWGKYRLSRFTQRPPRDWTRDRAAEANRIYKKRRGATSPRLAKSQTGLI